MEIIKEGKLTVLKADEGYKLKNKNDNYIPKKINEDGSVTEEYIPYYFEKAYIPHYMSLEKISELYEEIKECDMEG